MRHKSGKAPFALPAHVVAPGRWAQDQSPERSGDTSELAFSFAFDFYGAAK